MNKHKEGTVYTPEHIAKYIAKAAIETFLLKKIKSKFSIEISNLNDISNNNYEYSNKQELYNYFFELLNSLTVLDPAVGIGHFIIASLKVLEVYYFNLRDLGIINWPNYKIREHIISNNLFGVDIDIKAINTTKRKLLSKLKELEINIERKTALENIDSHFKVGNTLVGFLRKSEIAKPTTSDLNSCFYAKIKNVFGTHKDLKKTKLTEKQMKYMVFNLNPFHWFQKFPEIMEMGGFDIIIGNPPYISNKQLSSLEKAIFQDIYMTPKGLMNIFGIFIERSIELCHSSSILSFIVHKNIIRSNNYDLLRKYLLENTIIKEIIDVGAGAFQSITAETVIIVLATRPPSEDHEILIKSKFNYQNNEIFDDEEVIINKVAQKTYLEQDNYNFNLELQYKELDIINYIKDTRDCDLIDYFEAKTCIATGNDKKFLTDHKIDNRYKKTLRGKNIGRYYIDFDNLYVFYDEKTLHRAREESIFQNPEKLIMRTISSNLTVAYDNKNYYPLSTCIAIIPQNRKKNRFSIKFLLLIMNSKLMNFYYDFVFNLGAHLTTEISVNNIERLPLKTLQYYGLFDTLADFMTQLNEKKALREENKENVEFLQDLIDCMIIEIFFFDRFQSDGLKTELNNEVSKHIINGKLNSIKQIKDCVKKILDDKKIIIQIKNIKKYPWVRMIENYIQK
ncbi:MAG: Eco57I restriction-modification methylase domain-containing protein [Candidatus Thorarchaeota archaeon]